MLLTRNGRFNSDSFYTEAPRFSQDNAYDASLLTAVQNALSQNFSITKEDLDNSYAEYKKTNVIPKTIIKKTQQTKISKPAMNTVNGAQPKSQNKSEISKQEADAFARENLQFISWNEIKSTIGKNPRYCSININPNTASIDISESKTPTMFVFYKYEKTQNLTKMVVVPSPSLFDKDGRVKGEIPTNVVKIFPISTTGGTNMKVDGVYPLGMIYDAKGNKFGFGNGQIDLTSADSSSAS